MFSKIDLIRRALFGKLVGKNGIWNKTLKLCYSQKNLKRVFNFGRKVFGTFSFSVSVIQILYVFLIISITFSLVT